MTPTLLLCLSLSGWPTGEQLADLRRHANDALVKRAFQGQQARSWPALPNLDVEAFHREHLEWHRRRQAFLQAQIEWMEKLLEENPGLFPPERASRHRQLIEKLWRMEEKGKKYQAELELWERQRKLNPGVETDRAALQRLDQLLEDEKPSRPAAPPPREVEK